MNKMLRVNVSTLVILGLVSVFAVIIAVGAAAQSFEEYKNKQDQMRIESEETGSEKKGSDDAAAFEAYQKEQMAEFEQYKQIVARAFKQYQHDILEKWETAEVSTKKRWVAYSADYETRWMVDFEQGFIELDIIVDDDASQENINAAINQELADMVLINQRTAYEQDQLASGIEAEMQQSSVAMETAGVDEKPVLTRMLTDTDKPSQNQVEAAVSGLVERAAVSEKPAAGLENKKVVNVKSPLPPDGLRRKAMEYHAEVNDFAGRRGLSAALVFSIIHTESSFNPMARSHIPAYGLMQIVPESAGKDVAAMLYGAPRLLSPSYLYNTEKNINAGTTYFHILFNRYLRNIEDPETRMYCAIAAYNTGAGNVAMAFVGTRNISRAVPQINQMTPEAVYQHLVDNLPYQETRHYLEKVVQRMEMYAAL